MNLQRPLTQYDPKQCFATSPAPYRQRRLLCFRPAPACYHAAPAMSDPIHELKRIFAPEGPLAAAVPGFRPRPQQLEMAQRIAAAIAGNPALQDAAQAPNRRSQIGLGGQRILLADCRFKAVGVWRRIRCRATKSRRLAAACAGLWSGLSGAPRIRCAGKQGARSKAL